MEKELALRTFGYLIGHYKTHEETIINSQEIEAINYILDENERLENQLKKQKEIIDKLKRTLIDSKEYKLTTSMELNSEQSILIKLLQILEDKEV